MSILTEAQAKAILDKVIKLSTADECTAQLAGSIDGNIRFALNNVSTSGIVDNTELAVQVAFGKRVGVATINEFDDASLERVVRRAEDLAKLAPENPEFVPAVQKQNYTPTPTFSDSTAAITPEFRAKVAEDSIKPCRGNGLVAAGFLEDGQSFVAFANSNGNFGYQRGARFDYTCTVRTEDGRGSGWVGRSAYDPKQFDARETSEIAIDKALRSVDAKALEPGRYTVILEPAATSELLGYMLFGLDARSADEGRSFLSKPGGKTKLGEKLVDERVNIYSDPSNPELPTSSWAGDGRPQEKVSWFEKGVLKNLQYSRYWAQKQGVKAVPSPDSIIMDGTNTSLEELIKGTEKGILVTRMWYIRPVDPQTLLFTGLTRDGTFYVENGQIKFPIKNMRFNESPVIMLNNLDALGKPERAVSGESFSSALIPPMRIRDFTFTSLSDAV